MDYIIRIKRIPHPRYKNLVKMDRWCNKHCNKWQHGRTEYGKSRSSLNFEIFEFEDVKDAVRFKLEWG